MTETKQIVEIGFFAFLRAFQAAVQEGWVVSDRTEHFPTMSHSGLCEAVLVKAVQPATQEPEKKPAGRPRKEQ